MSSEIPFTLRPATIDDFPLAERLYLETMEPLLSHIGHWDREEFVGRIKALFDPAAAKIIIVDGAPAGWLQLAEADGDINIVQLHLTAETRNRGIGTALLENVLNRARETGKTASLSSPRNNRAIELYKRLGFVVSRDDGGGIIDMIWWRDDEDGS